MLKRLLSIGFILALAANGWGSALAAYLCPHEDCVTSGAAPSHAGAHEVDAETEEHCSGDAGQVERPEHESHRRAVEEPLLLSPAATSLGAPGGLPFCGHCVSAPRSPSRNTVKSTQTQGRRGDDVSTPPVVTTVALLGVASFPALAPSQCSPPLSSKRRHLLLSTFLI